MKLELRGVSVKWQRFAHINSAAGVNLSVSRTNAQQVRDA